MDEKHKQQSEQELQRENLRIRKTEWIQEQIQRQRQAEDALFLQMKQEQEVLDTLRDSMNQNMQTTREARKYNREFQESMDAQVYAMYGISTDKLQGMREYRNAYYQGCAFSLFLLSVILSVLCGVLHGLQSQIFLFMVAFNSIEGALLTGEDKRGKVLNFCCKMLYLLMFPMMMVIFVCFELKYLEYDLLLPIFIIFGMAALVIGTASYFLHNPYRVDRRVVEEAKDTIRDIEKTARREVKRNRKTREKAERKEIRRRQKSQARAVRKQAFFSLFKRLRTAEAELEEQNTARLEQNGQTEEEVRQEQIEKEARQEQLKEEEWQEQTEEEEWQEQTEKRARQERIKKEARQKQTEEEEWQEQLEKRARQEQIEKEARQEQTEKRARQEQIEKEARQEQTEEEEWQEQTEKRARQEQIEEEEWQEQTEKKARQEQNGQIEREGELPEKEEIEAAAEWVTKQLQ